MKERKGQGNVPKSELIQTECLMQESRSEGRSHDVVQPTSLLHLASYILLLEQRQWNRPRVSLRSLLEAVILLESPLGVYHISSILPYSPPTE